MVSLVQDSSSCILKVKVSKRNVFTKKKINNLHIFSYKKRWQEIPYVENIQIILHLKENVIVIYTLCIGKFDFTKFLKQRAIIKVCFIRARSERGSRRLPRERSSEISKNWHKKCLCIHPRGNKSGRRIWAFFVGFWGDF